MQEKDLQYIELLKQELIQLSASFETLKLSVSKCQQIGIKDFYTFEEQESFDSLTSKFSRTSDLFTQKVLRTSWMLLHEAFLPFIDFVNVAEKIGLIEDAESLLIIRDIRNQIAHEYIPEIIFDLIPEIIEMTYKLENNIQTCKSFLELRNWV
jgi:hypothetical protein